MRLQHQPEHDERIGLTSTPASPQPCRATGHVSLVPRGTSHVTSGIHLSVAQAIALAGLRGSSTESEREKARGRIVDAMKNGGHLVIACSNSAPSFKSKIFEETSFPEELFDAVEITKKEVRRIGLSHTAVPQSSRCFAVVTLRCIAS